MTPYVFGFHKRLGISWPSEWLSASEEVMFSLKLGSSVKWLTAACTIVVTYPVDRIRFSAPPHFEIAVWVSSFFLFEVVAEIGHDRSVRHSA